jgi:hypothetical protein
MLLGLMLTGCGDGPYTYWQESATSYGDPNFTLRAAASGTSLTVIRQNPFANDRNDDGVFGALLSSYHGRSYKFSRGAAPADWNGHTLMLTFSDGVIGNSNPCRSSDVPLLRPSSGRTAIVADYCLGPILLAEVKGWTMGVTGPDDPKFVALVHGIMSEMFMQRMIRDHGISGGCTKTC